MGHKPPIPERLSLEGKDFLSHCLESEPRLRWTASQLLDHSFVKVRLPAAPHALPFCLQLALKQEMSTSDGRGRSVTPGNSVCGFFWNLFMWFSCLIHFGGGRGALGLKGAGAGRVTVSLLSVWSA